MRLLLPLLFLLNFHSFAQPKNFKLTDTVFYAGQEIDLDIRFYANPRIVFDTITDEYMDSVKNFVLVHPDFVFEIQCNTDYRGDSISNYKLTEMRSSSVKRWLEDSGVKSEGLKTNPKGERCPATLTPGQYAYTLLPKELQTGEDYLLNEMFVTKFKSDRKLFDHLNQLNRRTVLRIVSI